MAEDHIQLVGTMPTFRDLYPHFGSVGKKFVIRKIKKLYLRDCLFVLSKLSRHYVKYCQMSYAAGSMDTYRERCLELLSQGTKRILLQAEKDSGDPYDVIFSELPVSHLIKLCLKYCDKTGYTKGEFEREALETIGDSLLVANSLMVDAQQRSIGSNRNDLDTLVVNFTKQLIVDENFHILQKLYQNYFLFNEYLPKYKSTFDIEKVFMDKYQLTPPEYFAFLFLVYSQFVITNAADEDWQMPYFDFDKGLSNLKPKFQTHLVNNLLINNFRYKKIDESFYSMNDLTKRPFIKFEDGVVVPLSLRRLFIGLTDSVYFDILDFLPDRIQKSAFASAFGSSVEDYVVDVVTHIDPKAIPEFPYGTGQKTTDVISIQKDGVVFFECKKRQFHNLDFLQNGSKDSFYERLTEFCFKPLKQVCDRISDFRSGKYDLAGVSKDAMIYPVIVCPIAPPLLSGAWDKLDLDKHILPDAYKTDKNIAPPEFIDFAELECIEEYLTQNPKASFVELIKTKRADKDHHNANWMVILYKNGMALQNKRLGDKYMAATKDFKGLLFDGA